MGKQEDTVATETLSSAALMPIQSLANQLFVSSLCAQQELTEALLPVIMSSASSPLAPLFSSDQELWQICRGQLPPF